MATSRNFPRKIFFDDQIYGGGVVEKEGGILFAAGFFGNALDLRLRTTNWRTLAQGGNQNKIPPIGSSWNDGWQSRKGISARFPCPTGCERRRGELLASSTNPIGAIRWLSVRFSACP